MKSSLLALVLLLSLSTPAGAQVRTWVSVHGSDAAPCTKADPCRNFAAAIAAVADGGEVVVLDSGGFGAVVIDKPVAILAPEGIHAAIAPTMGDAISIVDPGGPVSLRNLFLNSQGGDIGISCGSVSDLVSVDGCVISNFGLYGMIVYGGSPAPYAVTDSDFRNNGNTGMSYGGSFPGALVIDRCRFDSNRDGLYAFGNGAVTVRNSVAAGSDLAGFVFRLGSGQIVTIVDSASANNLFGVWAANETPGTAVTIHLEGCTLSGNGTGILSSATAGTTTVYVAGSTIVFNDSGIAGGTIRSRGNNTVEHNTMNNAFTDLGFGAK